MQSRLDRIKGTALRYRMKHWFGRESLTMPMAKIDGGCSTVLVDYVLVCIDDENGSSAAILDMRLLRCWLHQLALPRVS